MRRTLLVVIGILFIIGGFMAPAIAADCVTIQSGTLQDAKGNLLTLGYDKYGYNYQAHMFNGFYENYTRPDVLVADSDTILQMKWSDAWLSNKSCDGDPFLDRGFGTLPTGVSKGWLTNHMHGSYTVDGETYNWTYFVKIVYMPDVANACEALNVIWGSYCIIEEVSNDPYLGFHGINKDLLVNPAGLGFYTH